MGKTALSLFLTFALLLEGAFAQPTSSKNGGLVSLDFHDVDIQDVVKSISEITGKNFVLDDRVRGKVTNISPSPVSIDEAYQAFLAALAVKNLCTVEVGKITKVLPLRECKGENVPFESEETKMMGDQVITRLIQLQYINA